MSNVRRGTGHRAQMKNYAQLNAKNVGFGLDRTEKGITLVSLVVTIVVLLILAGISLSLIMGDGGILNRATNAAKTYSIAQAQEKVELLIAEYSYDYLQTKYVNGNESIDPNTYILNQLSSKVGSFEGCELEINNNELILSKDGKTVVGTFGTDGAISWADSTSGGSSGTEILPSKSYVGCYIYKDGQYAVIYADLLAQQGTTLTWSSTNPSQCVFPVASVSEFKSYEIGTTKITPTSTDTTGGKFGPNYQITEKSGTSGRDRFLAMALSDLGAKNYYFYYNGYGNMTGDTVKGNGTGGYEIGAGINNTATLISKWNSGSNGGYGEQVTSTNKSENSLSYYDMWEDVATNWDSSATATRTSKWFVPSFAEWCAFAKMSWDDAADTPVSRSIDTSNYNTTYRLSNYYWSSSQDTANGAWDARFNDGCMNSNIVNNYYRVRLSTTF